MGLPTNVAYSMPAEEELPPNVAAWALTPDRAVLLVHDMQNYFVRPFDAETSPYTELVANISRLREFAAAAGIPVIFSAQPGDQAPGDRGLLTDFWGKGLNGQPEHEAIVPALEPCPEDAVITKWRYSAFQRTGLQDRITAMGRNQLIVCGIYAHIGCLMTACEAFMRDIQPFFIADAVADFSRVDHDMAVSYASQRCAAVLTTRQCVETALTTAVS